MSSNSRACLIVTASVGLGGLGLLSVILMRSGVVDLMTLEDIALIQFANWQEVFNYIYQGGGLSGCDACLRIAVRSSQPETAKAGTLWQKGEVSAPQSTVCWY